MRYIKGIVLLLVVLIAIGNSNDATAQQRKKKAKVRTTAQLTDTYWKLFEMDGKPVVTPADSREVYIKLVDNKKGDLEGYAGCNLVGGRYTLGKESLRFEPTATLRMCDDMTTENYIFKALNNADRYEINGMYLLLYKGTYLLAIFEAKYYEED